MKIELLLKHVSQDQASPDGSVDAFYGWRHGPGSGDGNDSLPVYSLRKEEWGGVLVYGPTLGVYLLDPSAYELFSLLARGESVSSLRVDPESYSLEDLATFEAILAEHGIAG